MAKKAPRVVEELPWKGKQDPQKIPVHIRAI
jgi:hypothetical protein